MKFWKQKNFEVKDGTNKPAFSDERERERDVYLSTIGCLFSLPKIDSTNSYAPSCYTTIEFNYPNIEALYNIYIDIHISLYLSLISIMIDRVYPIINSPLYGNQLLSVNINSSA